MGLYKRRSTSPVKAHRLTVDNLDQLADWCKGSVKGTRLPPENRIVRFYNAYYPGGEADAEVGDWIVKESGGFSIYNDHTFNEVFEILSNKGN